MPHHRVNVFIYNHLYNYCQNHRNSIPFFTLKFLLYSTHAQWLVTFCVSPNFQMGLALNVLPFI